MCRYLWFVFIGFVIVLSLQIFSSSQVIRASFPPRTDYEVITATKIGSLYNQPLYLEKTLVGEVSFGDFWMMDLGFPRKGMERMQVTNGRGNVFAYTPTRFTAIPFCPVLQMCYVFMWKTVYPYPAIFKLDSDMQSWGTIKNPPMHYSRRGNDGVDFQDVTNLLLGTFGVILFLKEMAAYFCILVLLSIILCLQLAKYDKLADHQKKWVKRILSFILTPSLVVPLPVEPYIITACLIFLLASTAVYSLGVSFVISVAVVFATLLLCSYRLGKELQKYD